MYPGYTLGAVQEVIAEPGTKTVNFNTLWDCLRSKDPSLLDKNSDLFDGTFRFLDNTVPITNQKVAYCTYPRSGNSYLRRVLEQCTGISTGATVSLHTSTTLQIQGLKGEFIADDRAWIIKAHHPGNIPMNLSFVSNKVICCVRNPFDVI